MHAKTKMNPRLTKTAFMLYLQCPPEFWLQHHEPLLFASADPLEYEHLRQQGYAVEQLVKQLGRFGTDKSYTVDFQRDFQTADLSARSDVVVTDRATGEIDIYEIKSSSEVKPAHHDDVAFQKVVAERMGLAVRNLYVITVNSDYIRRGEIDVEQMFTINDVSDVVSARSIGIEVEIPHAFAYLETVPVPSLADYCKANKLDCKFLQLHFPDLPERTVFELYTLKHEKRREMIRAGIIDLLDVPDDYKLSEKQRALINEAKTGTIAIDCERIAAETAKWQYPLHFLDYETLNHAIPQFEGVRPFQQMCFQYSLHTIDTPGAEPRHTGFLSRGDGDPPRAVAEHLRDAMGDNIGTVFVWYESFEKGRNQEMAEMFPDMADFFAEVNEKTYDLMKVFSEKLYCHPDFKGRSSIKVVLPILAPHLSYEKLGIGEGKTAYISWFRAATWASLGDAERQKIFNDLDEYCELDTFAMVEIYNVLRSL